MKYAGMHWPNGPENYERIMALPSPSILMLATEARYHYDKVRKAGKTVVWRALPRVGKRPAEIGYSNLKKNADEVMNLWDEQPHYGTEYFVPYNELDLNYERGDSQDDFSGLQERYHLLSSFLNGILPQLRNRLPQGTRILFPPWTPDHGDIEHVALWKDTANMYDGLVIHAYENPEHMLERFHWYAEQFPGKPIFIGEWNSSNPKAFLEALKTLENHPQFLGATYFAWHWHGAPNYWPTWYDVDTNSELYTLFMEDTMPEIQWPVEPQERSKDDVITEAINTAETLRIPARVLLALLIAESGLRWNSSRFAYRNEDGSYTNLTAEANDAIAKRDVSKLQSILTRLHEHGSDDISFGVGQQTVRWATEGDHSKSIDNVLLIRSLYFDIRHAVAVAGGKIAGYWNTYRDDLEALCRYNKPTIPGVNNSNRKNYERGLKEADAILAERNEAPSVVQVIIKKTGNIAGAMVGTPKGFLLHGSRSGIKGNPKKQEALACANWCINNPDGMGWHATIGEGEYYVHMPANKWGWNAFEASKSYIAVEFAQATVDEAISDAQVEAFVSFCKNEVFPVYPNIPLVLKTHAEVEKSGETVKTSGKTDVFPYGDARAEELKQRIMNTLKGAAPVPEFEFHFGFEAKANELGRDVVGDPIENETYISDILSFQMTTKGIMLYSKNANTVKFIATK